MTVKNIFVFQFHQQLQSEITTKNVAISRVKHVSPKFNINDIQLAGVTVKHC